MAGLGQLDSASGGLRIEGQCVLPHWSYSNVANDRRPYDTPGKNPGKVALLLL